MKIGEFAKKFNVSIDTIRYYMELGLLIPPKNNSCYCFNTQCIEDMEFILEYKKFKFSVQEILKLISLKRMVNSSDSRFYKYLASQLQKKMNSITTEIVELEKIINLMENKSKEYIYIKQNNIGKTGLNVRFASYFQCPDCKSNIALKNIRIDGEYIKSGNIKCKCGYTAKIKDGVIFTPIDDIDVNDNSSEGIYSGVNLDTLMRSNYKSFLLCYESYNWMYKKVINYISENKDSEKLILTSGSNSGKFIFYHLLNKSENLNLLKNCIFIICIPSRDIIIKFKKLVETFGHYKKLNVVFIMGNPDNLPIKMNSINLFIDEYSTLSYYYYTNKSKFLQTAIRKYFKSNAELIGFIPYDFYSHYLNTNDINRTEFLDILQTQNYEILDTNRITLPSRNKNASKSNNKNSYLSYYIRNKSVKSNN